MECLSVEFTPITGTRVRLRPEVLGRQVPRRRIGWRFPAPGSVRTFVGEGDRFYFSVWSVMRSP
jgi:hypothetical protein